MSSSSASCNSYTSSSEPSSSSSSQSSESAGRRHMNEAVHQRPNVEPNYILTTPNACPLTESGEISSNRSSPPPYDSIYPPYYDGHGYGTFYGHRPSSESALIDLMGRSHNQHHHHYRLHHSDTESSSPTLARFDLYREVGTDWGEVFLTVTYAVMILFTLWFIRALFTGELSFWS